MRGRWLYAAAAVAFLAACDDSDRRAGGPELLVAPVFAHEAGQAHGFRTNLSGSAEVPPVATRARGQAIFQVADDAIGYRLIVANIENVTQAHIHIAPPGANGPVAVWLFPAAPPATLVPGRSQGILAEGTITAADLVGPLEGGALEDLVAEIRSGNAYVNVHTSQYPPGEIRGQIR
jgi:hypothetical protein